MHAIKPAQTEPDTTLGRGVSQREPGVQGHAARLHFLESMDHVSRAIQGTTGPGSAPGNNNVAQTMSDVLDVVLSVFDCDRAWLIYPCNPHAASWRVPMERTRPEYPGALALGTEVPMDAAAQTICRTVLAANGPVSLGPDSQHAIAEGAIGQFSIKSILAMAIYPKADAPYVFGLHQCSYPRVWTTEEKRLFEEIGGRLADALTSQLTLRGLLESERRLAIAQRVAHVGYWEHDPETGRLDWSDETYRIFGLRPQEHVVTIARLLDFAHPDDRGGLLAAIQRAMSEGTDFGVEYRLIRPGGEVRVVQSNGNVLRDESGRPTRRFGTVQDITDRKRADEEQYKLRQHLQQAQKMEAVGRLAGGVAHDFNNVLGVINGYSQILLDDPDIPETALRRIREIFKAGQHAASLTRQLLAFSRKQMLQPQVLNLNQVVEGVENMIGRLIGDHIEVRTVLAADLVNVSADRGQMEQVLLNLCVNARDAMPQGGLVTIQTSNVQVAKQSATGNFPMRAGRYACFSVSDTGFGIEKEVLQHIFEPFFTTKEPEDGTGLGLATVYGIVKQSSGYVWATSQPGTGSTFSVYLPATGEAALFEQPPAPQEIQVKSKTILLVEDSSPLRELIRELLVGFGYTVLEAENAERAEQLAQHHPGRIALLLTDLSLPKISGLVLAESLLKKKPGLKVLYISGHHDAIVQGKISEPGSDFLQKPFTREALAEKLERLLVE